MAVMRRRTFLRAALGFGGLLLMGRTAGGRFGYGLGYAPGSPNRELVASAGWWQDISDPRSFYYNGLTLFGYIEQTTGDVELGIYNHSTGVVTVRTLHSALEYDAHASPSVIVTVGGYVVVGYSSHDGAQPLVRVSTSTLDADPTLADGFEAEQSIGSASDITYISLIQLGGVTNDPIYMFYRVYASSLGRIAYRISTDGGASWSSETQLIIVTGSGNVAYWEVGSDWDTRIDIVTTDTDRSAGNPSSIYHLYLDGTAGTWHQSDGTTITATKPFAPSNATLVSSKTDSPAGPRMALSVGWNGSVPHVLYKVYDSSAVDNLLYSARWTGSAWTVHYVGNSNGILNSNQYMTSGCVDRSDPDIVWFPVKVGSHFELYRWSSANSGASWTGTPLTGGSAGDYTRPQSPVNATDPIGVVVPFGTFTSDTNFSAEIRGLRG